MPPSATVAHIATPLIGISTGLRSFTPLAVTSWFAYQNKLPLAGTWAAWVAHPAAVGIFTAAAIGEYVGDKLPNTPDRTAPLGLVGRLTLGGLAGAIIATTFRRPVVNGVVAGLVGAAIGTFGGFYLRRGLTVGSGLPDLPVALSGDLTAVALAVRSLDRLTAA